MRERKTPAAMPGFLFVSRRHRERSEAIQNHAKAGIGSRDRLARNDSLLAMTRWVLVPLALQAASETLKSVI
jgi:hypothetical protein